MSSKFHNRNTQIDFRALGRGRSFSPDPKLSGQTEGPPKPPGDGLDTRSDTTNKLSRNRARTPQEDTVDAAGGLRTLKLPTIFESGIRANEELKVKRESPWKSYEKSYNRQLGGSVTVATRKVPLSDLVMVREFPESSAEKTLYMFQRIQHENFIAALEAFMTEKVFYIVLEHMPISLDEIIRCPAYPNELQLAAIIGQILEGLGYLASEGLEHGSLSCSNILVSTEGDVKIANQECCHTLSKYGDHKDVKALGFIQMELMQKYVKDDGAIGVDDLLRWPSNSNAVGFLSQTTSAASVAELMKHPLLKCHWRKEKKLKGIISLAQVSLRPRYKYIQ